MKGGEFMHCSSTPHKSYGCCHSGHPHFGPHFWSTDKKIEMLEQHLEIERHARLVSLKSDPVSSQAEFATDGCSGGLTIGWEYLAGKIASYQQQHDTQPAWENCCVEHDRRCHTGGPGKLSASESFCTALGFHKGGRQSCPETMLST